MKVHLFVANNDPLTDELRDLIDAALAEAGVADPQVDVTTVLSADEAKELRCLGSPTIRVEGLDIEYGEREPPETTVGERFYSTPEGWTRTPTKGMIVFAINEAKARLAGGTSRG